MDCPRCASMMFYEPRAAEFSCLTCGAVQYVLPGLTLEEARHEQREVGMRHHMSERVRDRA